MNVSGMMIATTGGMNQPPLAVSPGYTVAGEQNVWRTGRRGEREWRADRGEHRDDHHDRVRGKDRAATVGAGDREHQDRGREQWRTARR